MDKSFELDQRSFHAGEIILYKRPDHKNPKWQCRVHVPGSTGYVVKSTKTADEFEARRFAEDMFDDLRLKVKQGGSLKGKSFAKCFDEFKVSFQPIAPSAGRYRDVCSNIEQYAVPYFGKEPVESIDSKAITSFLDWRRKNFKRKAPSNNTLRAELSSLKTFIEWSQKRGYTAQLIDWDRPTLQNNRRPHFGRADWTKLTRFMREWIKKGKGVGGKYRERLMLCQYVLILANSGIRVGEARLLKWRDIETQARSAAEGVKTTDVIFWVRGKTGSRDVVARSKEVSDYLRRIWEMRTDELGKPPEIEGYVFCHRDGKPIGSFKGGFKAMTEAAGVLKSSDGDKRTIYSLRHTYATFRLEENVSSYLLAKNMGTSVKMLEQFYGHTVNRSNAAELTKTRGRRGKIDSPKRPWEKIGKGII